MIATLVKLHDDLHDPPGARQPRSVEHGPQREVDLAVVLVGVVVRRMPFRVGVLLVRAVGDESVDRVRDALVQAAPTAARIAAPAAVVSTLVGTRTGRPVTSALICRHRVLLAPPPTIVNRSISSPAACIAVRMSRNANALPSSSARVMCPRVCAS